MTITKSLRISEEENEFIQKLKEYENEPTESAVLGRIFGKGLQKERANLALEVYQENQEKVNLRAVAEDFNVAPSYLYSLCQERGIRILQADQDDFQEELDRAEQFLDSEE